MPIRVYLADDHPIVREGLRRLLATQSDMTVVGEAGDGLQAVQEVFRLKPDVVVMDIALPGLNGIEATRQIHETRPSTQIVILSIHSTADHILGSLRAGARAYLLKESAGEEVVEAVRTVCAGRRFLSPRIGEIILEHQLQEDADDTGRLECLSSREREILQFLAEGKSNPEIGQILHLSTKTVETYRSRLMRKLKVHDLPGLVRFAFQQGLIDLGGRR